MTKRQPVRTIYGVKQALDDGGVIEVECLTSASREGSVYRGEWRFYLHSCDDEDGEVRALVVTHRALEPKVVRTVHGLVGLAAELGIDAPVVPLSKGQKGTWTRERTGADTQK